MKIVSWAIVLMAVLPPFSNAVLASPLSLSGDIDWLSSPPPSLKVGELTSSTYMFGFTERQGYTLVDALIVNGVGPGMHDNNQTGQQSIGRGTAIDSYFIHAEILDNSLRTFNASILFDSDILAVIFNDVELDLSDLALGATGTAYPVYYAREFDPVGAIYDFVTITADARSIAINLQVGGALDELRIITAASAAPIPEPTTMLLFGTGLALLAAVGRTKKG